VAFFPRIVCRRTHCLAWQCHTENPSQQSECNALPPDGNAIHADAGDTSHAQLRAEHRRRARTRPAQRFVPAAPRSPRRRLGRAAWARLDAPRAGRGAECRAALPVHASGVCPWADARPRHDNDCHRRRSAESDSGEAGVARSRRWVRVRSEPGKFRMAEAESDPKSGPALSPCEKSPSYTKSPCTP
jgi:hypothetical protein